MYQILIIIVILLIYYAATIRQSISEEYLYGFWVAENDEFCANADIESMLLFIGERIDGARQCYIIIMNDIVNTSFVLKHSRGWAGPWNRTYNINGTVEFESADINWPDNLNFSADIVSGVLTISDDTKVYARLNKQHEITNDAAD